MWQTYEDGVEGSTNVVKIAIRPKKAPLNDASSMKFLSKKNPLKDTSGMKFEDISSKDHDYLNSNPWEVDDIYAFNFFCCPECAYRSKAETDFQNHAVISHQKAKDFFDKCEKQYWNEPEVAGKPLDDLNSTKDSSIPSDFKYRAEPSAASEPTDYEHLGTKVDKEMPDIFDEVEHGFQNDEAFAMFVFGSSRPRAKRRRSPRPR